MKALPKFDETQCRYSEKRSCQLSADKPCKCGGDKSPKVKVVIGIDRSGHVIDDFVGHFTLAQQKENFLPKFLGYVVLCTDGHINYEYLAKQEKNNHVVLKQSLGEHVKEKVFHIQTGQGYHMRLKQWLVSFHGVTTKNFYKYVGYFRSFEPNKHGNLSPANFIKDMLCLAFQKLRQA